MASYTMLQNGSQGDEVKKLQQSLMAAGYDVGKAGADGIYGNATAAAVKKYQQDNKLDVDGIAGEQTLGKLYGGSSSSSSSSSSSPSATTPTSGTTANNTATYKESDTVKQAQAMLQQQMANKPGAYQSPWQDQLNSIIDKIQNREAFSYDLNGDALYQQYKDQYTTQGKMAMMDTMGQAAALTGGYGNSYAQGVGQQAYQGYLQKLNEVVPELYSLAMDQNNREGDEMYDQFALLNAQDEQAYGRHRDSVADYYTNLDYLTNRYDAERDYDYGKWADGRDFAYQQDRDKVADERWQAEFDEAKRQYDQQYALAKAESSGSNGGSTGGSNGGNNGGNTGNNNTGSNGGFNNHGLDKDVVKKAQAFVGAGVDGMWGSESAARAKEMEYNSLVEVVTAMDSGSPAPGPTLKDTENTKLFRSSIMTGTEFTRHGNKATVKGKTYTSYKSYIEAALADWTDNDVPYIGKNLTDDEVNFLMDYYGL